MKKYLIMLLIIMCSSFSVFGEEGQNKKIDDLRQRIEQLERENKDKEFYGNLYENQLNILKEDFENKKTGLEVKFDKLSQDNFSIFLGALVITIFGTLFSISKINAVKEKINEVVDSSVKNQVDKEVKNKIEEESRLISNKILNEYRERILDETVLKLSKNILILSSSNSNTYLKKIFTHKSYGFKMPIFEMLDKFELNKNYDLIIFNCEMNDKDEELEKMYKFFEENKAKFEKTVFMYFNTKGKQIDFKKFGYNTINSSTNKTTVYEQIMNSLKYQDFLEKSST